mmetsp:Transcript_68108/g.142258  ORF Transcript_68108/g.142258 Transcript_68108/m.142258 type:complete len:482 (-) Transcript_68108:261-1706(-)|eukprot:CAMPEP_0206449968 /NCGR_PEP_ID=MMETSP0324_2-20121206/18426_1 /ASSEMBLY_ACC=CAM_ASM_000836 /TAXON_ID=2866 /ORGANISM="Crypthecodinium cohnii, Strain Seligo" /LENGTH=481 /DNA_ID=CAMNT_0053919489 /DNA_START=112 /DNA_END=1557 /DNA_ORIENTATION=-
MAPKAVMKASPKKPMGIKKKKEVIKGGGRGIRSALIKQQRSKAGREVDFNKRAVDKADEVPPEKRPGAPLKGGFPLKKWAEKFPDMVVDLGRSAWLPDNWGQGIKMTTPTAHSTGTGGGTLVSFISPDGRRFFHKCMVEELEGRKLDAYDGIRGQLRKAQLEFSQNLESAVGSDKELFQVLTPKEKQCLPPASDLWVGIISARRATKPQGLKDLIIVQAAFRASGVEPVWYVDEPSLDAYKKLGLNAKVGGKLTHARNMALKDAAKAGKACVQVSDDISRWEYRHGPRATEKGDEAANRAHDAAERYVISPVGAARFALAKLRAKNGPKLAGVYPLGSCSRAFGHAEEGRNHFILGDFFVVDSCDKKSDLVLFDEEMTLKEDYDFTCSHISKYGSVLRLNRMTIAAKHATNPGGAVEQRDKKGKEEEKNIDILVRKWPRAFHRNPTRKHEVVLRWPGSEVQPDADGADEEATKAAKKAKKA